MATITNPLRKVRTGGHRLTGTALSQWWSEASTTVRRALEDRAGGLAVFATATFLALFSTLDLVARGELDIDFRSFFFAWKAARLGADVYDVSVLNNLAEQMWTPHNHVWPYIYPPFLAYVFSPIAALGFPRALVGWALASIAAMGLAVTAIVASLAPRPAATAISPAWRRLPLQEAVLLSALLVCLLPLRANIVHGQVNLFVLAFLALAMSAFVRGDDVWSGAWLAPAILIKVTPAVFLIAFLARGRYRAAMACAAALVLLAVATLPFGAWPAWMSYFHNLPRLSHGSYIRGLFSPAIVWNFSPAGMFSRWFSGQNALIHGLSAGFSLVLLSVAVFFARRQGRQPSRQPSQPADDARALAPFFPLMLLVSPLVYTHHVIYLAPAVAVWFDRAWRERRPWVLISVAILLVAAGADVPALYERLWWLTGITFRVMTSLNLYALFGLFLLGLHMLRAPPIEQPRGEAGATV